ncbi:MAG: porin family protein [Steroidobacteraceae bacterium]|jgi:opacity protein-like surface antigen|nr:porin family protein [Steroidobacteraceae bacterium]
MFSDSTSRKPSLGHRPATACALLWLAAAGSAGAATGPAGAGAGQWYATGILGAVTQSDQRLDYRRPGVTASASQTLPLDTGFAAGGSIGRYFGDAWRIEAEFMYQSVDHPAFTLSGGGPSGDGNYASTTIAVNALREFDLFGSSRARTYAGIGAVYATEVDLDFERGGIEQSFSGSGAGVQALLGARYSLGERAFVDAGLRYLLVSGVALDGEAGASGRIEADYEPIALTLSFGWRF